MRYAREQGRMRAGKNLIFFGGEWRMASVKWCQSGDVYGGLKVCPFVSLFGGNCRV